MKILRNIAFVLLGSLAICNALSISSIFDDEDEDCEIFKDVYKRWMSKSLKDKCCSKYVSGITCDNGRITKISLSHKSIKTELKSSDFTTLQKLKGLKKLDLSHNQIYGKIPNEVRYLNIDEINISHNYLSGEFPSIYLSEEVCFEDNYLEIENTVLLPTAVGCDNKDQNDKSELKNNYYPPDIDLEEIFRISGMVLVAIICIPIILIIICVICCCCVCNKKGKKKFRPALNANKHNKHNKLNNVAGQEIPQQPETAYQPPLQPYSQQPYPPPNQQYPYSQPPPAQGMYGQPPQQQGMYPQPPASPMVYPPTQPAYPPYPTPSPQPVYPVSPQPLPPQDPYQSISQVPPQNSQMDASMLSIPSAPPAESVKVGSTGLNLAGDSHTGTGGGVGGGILSDILN